MRFLPLILLTLPMGCLTEREGAVAGQCSDYLDNDDNDLMDCDDPSCASDPACDAASDNDDTADTDGTNDSGSDQYTGDMYLGVDTSNPSYPTQDNGSAHAALNYGCDPATNSYWYLFYTIGWSSGGELTLTQTGVQYGWQEDYHDVPASSYGFDENGWWDSLYLALPIVSSPSDVVLNNTTTGDVGTTLFQCDQARLDTLSFLLRIINSSGTNSVCTTWGEDPSFFSNGGDWPGTACNDVWQ